MGSLASEKLKLSYRSDKDDLISAFFVPCLKASVLYQRSAGYFTSAGLSLAARGVASLASRNGRMQLVVSPFLDSEDIQALKVAAESPQEVLKAVASRNLLEIEDTLVRDRLNALAWLSAAGLLEVKIALRVDEKGNYSRGIFHEKVGVFSDEEGHQVAFSGSSNETAGGMVENFESIKVFCSWRDSEGRVQEEVDNFNALWENKTLGLQIVEFSDIASELLEYFRDPDKPPIGLKINRIIKQRSKVKFGPPRGFELRPYQADAIRAWVQAGGKGIFAMATGSGKTLTALTLASKVAEKNKPLVVIIVCPFINLCRQWIRDLIGFGARPIECFEGKHKWQQKLDEGYQSISVGLGDVLVLVATNATFQSELFQSRILSRISSGAFHHLLIADEVHNLGAGQSIKALPDGIQLRLGLSATPERHLDPVGTEAVLNYFGGEPVYKYLLKQAIAEGRLCRYRYHPITVQLTEGEADEYDELTRKLSRFFQKSNPEGEIEKGAMPLLIRRARLLAGARNKLHKLDVLIGDMVEKPKKAIFYCGDGRTTDNISTEEVRQIQAVSRLLGEDHNLRIRNFTYRESTEEREEILRDLESGFLDGVVAIRCLDEGIDMPELRIGFLLASSTNPRQFVQRRGRLLRNSPGKDRAEIFDFIVEPPDLGGDLDDAAFNMERSFMQRELKRITEFCRVAENGPEALHALKDLRIKYNLISE